MEVDDNIVDNTLRVVNLGCKIFFLRTDHGVCCCAA